jgi:hypothetical protein
MDTILWDNSSCSLFRREMEEIMSLAEHDKEWWLKLGTSFFKFVMCANYTNVLGSAWQIYGSILLQRVYNKSTQTHKKSRRKPIF